MGLIAARTIFRSLFWRLVLVVLIVLFAALVLQGHPSGWILVGAVVAATWLKKAKMR